MEKIAILGGTFNPVHNEHINLAKNAIKELNLDRLLIMPTFLPPHKSTIPASAEHRINMLKLAFKGIDKVEICDYEVIKQGKSYTFETVEYIKSKYDCELYLLMGDDMLVDFKTWKNPQRIVDKATVAVFGREGFFADYNAEQEHFKKTFNTQFIKLNYVGQNDSSTKIRIYCALGLRLLGLTPISVEKYIKDNNVYESTPYTAFLRKYLTDKRLYHTAGVVVAGMSKAKELNLDENKVFLATLLHDCAKYLNYEKVAGFTLEEDVPIPVIHSFLGAYVAEKLLGVEDKDVLDAIKYHTSGKAQMTTLQKLVFVSDMVEENRVYEGVERLQKSFREESLDECLKKCLIEEMEHLEKKGQPIYYQTLNAYNYYVKENKK